MTLAVRVEPAGARPPVEYRWDVDTDILTATVRDAQAGRGDSGSVEIVGHDGSWLVLEVAGGRIAGVEVAVWPTVRTLGTLALPDGAVDADVVLGAPGGASAADVEVNTRLSAEADRAERTIHFRVGPRRQTRAVRIASDVLLDVDARARIAGIWLLNVPPRPGGAADADPRGSVESSLPERFTQ